jgi:phospholipid/cholesterol/gamma-HCH transport system substrate-binding protein
METRASYGLIGAFTLAVVAAAFGFLYWFFNIGHAGMRAAYQVSFDGSVSGLRTGGTVLFNGIKVGEVTGLKLDPRDPGKIIATIAVESGVPVRSDTQVGLDFQGLTGIASLSLKGGTASAPPLAGKNGEPPVLIADPSATRDVTQTAREVLLRLDGFFSDNQGSLNATVKNIEAFADTLARNADSLNATVKNVEAFSQTLARNSEKFDRVITGLDSLVGSDGKGDIQEAARSIRTLADSLDKRTAEISSGINRLAGSGLREWEALAADGRRTLSQIERAVKNFDRNPSRVIFGGSGNNVPEYNGRR